MKYKDHSDYVWLVVMGFSFLVFILVMSELSQPVGVIRGLVHDLSTR